MELKDLTKEQLVSKLNGLEISLEYNNAKGDVESVSEINGLIYEVRKELNTRRYKA